MKKKVKIVLAILGLGILAIMFFIVAGLYGMAIEDLYGDNQNFYYKSRRGDIIVNRDTGEFRTLEKSWTNIYFIDKSDTVDLWGWLDKNQVEIYRAKNNDIDLSRLSYDELNDLIEDKELKLIIRK